MRKRKFICGMLAGILGFSMCLGGCQTETEEPKVDFVTGETYDYTTGIDYTGTPLQIADDGETEYTIVVENDNQTVMAAANELNSYIRQSTGANLAITTEAVSDKFISLGDTPMLETAGIDTSLLQYDGFYIRTIGNNVYIAADIDRGVQNGVYSFLERFVGVRWLTETYTHVPKLETLNVYSCDIKEEPLFQMRYWMGGGAYLNNDFFKHCRYYEGKDVWFQDNGIPSGHNTIYYVSKDAKDPETLAEDPNTTVTLQEKHPEYFTTHTNNTGKDYDLCFTNGVNEDGTLAEGQSVASIMIDRIKSFLAEDAEEQIYEYFMIGKTDNRNCICLCNTCKDRRSQYNGSESGIMVMFCNLVAREVNAWLKETQNREINIITFAYQRTQTPPTTKNANGEHTAISPLVIADEHLYIRIAPIDANYTYSFYDERQDELQNDVLFGWAAVAKHFMIWDYQCNFEEYYWYFPTTHYLKENLQCYVDIGATFVMNQSAYTQAGIWFDEMRNYISSRLYWNLNWDVDALIDEYLTLYYGDSSDEVAEIYDIFDKYYAELRMQGKLEVTILSANSAYVGSELYPLIWLNKIIDKIDSAMENVSEIDSVTGLGAGAMQSRLEVIKMTPMRMIARNYTDYYSEDSKADYGKQFFDLCDKYRITALGETGIRSVETRKKDFFS